MKMVVLYFKESQIKLFKKEKEKTGVPTSELLRRLVDKYFKELKKCQSKH